MSHTKTHGSSTGHKGHVRDKHRNEEKAKMQQLSEIINSQRQEAADMLKDRNRALFGEKGAKAAQQSMERERDAVQEKLADRNATIVKLKNHRPWWVLLGAAGVGAIYLFGLRTTVGKGCMEVLFDAWNYWT